ncbi:sugar transferase [Niallia taxi]|nr:sugar transferase [Niallia taxi]
MNESVYNIERLKPLEVSNNYLVTKRIFDVCASIAGLIITAPLFLLITILYMFGDQKGPVFFKQKRVGKDGVEFYIYKFRSMVVNAEEKLIANKALYEKYIENSYKLEPDEDPRITSIGRFLRKTSLDELPQLINILIGNMSLVGPRPVISEELNEYGDKKDLFLSVKPGVTGFWQVSGRSNIGYPERVNLELHYVYNKSLFFDLKIVFLSFYSVALKKGAY